LADEAIVDGDCCRQLILMQHLLRSVVEVAFPGNCLEQKEGLPFGMVAMGLLEVLVEEQSAAQYFDVGFPEVLVVAVGALEALAVVAALKPLVAVGAREALAVVDALEALAVVDALEALAVVDALEALAVVDAVEALAVAGAHEALVDRLIPDGGDEISPRFVD